MEKTVNFNLNKPEAGDPMRVADFNENADKIDAALNSVRNEAVTLSAQVRAEAANALAAYQTTNDAAVANLNTAVGTKADKAALTAYQTANDAAVAALNTAVTAGMKMQTGTYKGKGTYGSGNPNKLTLNFSPKFLMIWGPFSHIAAGLNGSELRVMFDYSGWGLTTTWSGTTVSWYSSTGAQQQMNDNGYNYYYLALG